MDEQDHLRVHGRVVEDESLPGLDEVGAGRPGEIVDVLLDMDERLRPVGVLLLRLAAARGPDDVLFGDGDLDPVGAEIGEELGIGVILVAIPRAVLEDADLGEPLPDHVELPEIPRTGEHLGQAGRERDLEDDPLARADGGRERHLHDRLVVGVPVVRPEEGHGPGRSAPPAIPIRPTSIFPHSSLPDLSRDEGPRSPS